MKRFLVVCAMVLATAAGAADRHVYLNQSGGGTQLDDCPNPAHNAKGTSNTDELTYCAGNPTATHAGKITTGVASPATGRITDATCTGAADPGVVTAVTNGVQADVDGDGTLETVYGHPQACVWNMAKSDSCEVHAGEYKAAGARSLYTDVFSSTCVGGSNPGTNCTTVPGGECLGGGTCTPRCDRSDCWLSSVIATGYGPNMGTTGYGSAGSPGYLRGAVMGGSTDTWDSDGDKIPDTEGGEPTSYPPILSGDSDADGVLREATDCATTPSTCAGDAFYAVQVGCGNTNDNGGWCDTVPDTANGQTRPQLDSDADGTFDTAIATGGSKNVSYFTIKDIEFKNYSGGPATCSDQGIREGLGHLALVGGGTTSGYGDKLQVDHVYWHDGAYSNLCAGEHYVAILGDDENWACSQDFTELKSSLLYLDNRFVINDDCDASTPGASECGCSKSMHDNRIVVTNNAGGAANLKSLIRWKSVDTVGGGTRPKKLWIYNNEIIWQKADVGDSILFHAECIGKCDPWHLSLGQLSFHGNLVRFQGASSPRWKRLSTTFCSETIGSGGGGTNWTYWLLNNTFDVEQIGGGTSAFDYLCSTTGAKHISKSNAVRGVTAGEFNKESATLQTRLNNFCDTGFHPSCTQDSSLRTSWWTVGTQNVAVYAGLPNYIPNPADVLHEDVTTGNDPCDPDADGAAGMDYDGDGDQDTFWYDLAGNGVLCTATTTRMSIGAIQPNNDTPPAGDVTAPEAISNLAASSPTSSACTLTWTAPHEDGTGGGAVSSYDCRRRAGATFVEGDWAAATALTGEPSPPASPGGGETMSAGGLSASTQYAFACKSLDDVPNTSTISNATTCTTTAVSLCGNGVIDSGEECDGSAFGGKTCLTYGYLGGSLVCSSCTDSVANCRMGLMRPWSRKKR